MKMVSIQPSADIQWLFDVRPSLAVPVLAVSLGICYLIYAAVYNVFFNPLRKYPGPTLWAISRIPYTLMYVSGRSHRTMLQLHQKYGEIVRIAPNQLAFSNPEAWKHIMGHRKAGEKENPKAPHFYRDGNLSVIGADREFHGRQRRLLAHGFSAQAMLEQQPVIKQYVDLLMQKLRESGEGGSKPLNMVKWLNFTTFDIIGDLAFGEPFGSLNDGNYHPWVALIFDGVKGGALSFPLSFFPLVSEVMKMLIPKKLKERLKEHQDLTRHLVDKRLASDTNRLDFMQAMTRKHGSTFLSREEIYANSSTLVVAGSETTATALSGDLYYLCQNVDAMKKLVKEVRTSFKSEDEIDLLSVQRLPYLGACIEEGLRLYPPVPTGVPRVTPPEGDTIFGSYVPGGTILDIWQWAMYHNPAYFTNSEEFAPERWLGDPRFAHDRTDAVQPFSFGPRNCLGKNLAYAEMRLILARLIWNFDITLAEGSQGWPDHQEVYILYDKPALNLHMTPRKFE